MERLHITMGYVTRLTVSCQSEQSIPSWSGYQQLLVENPPKITIGFLPLITAPPTEVSVIYPFIVKALKILIEADQGIYKKLLDLTFKMY